MRLPAYEDLSKEQDAVLTLSIDGTYLISGAPGTGKTVVALYRASRIKREGNNVRMIMYSKLLSAYATATDRERNEIANSISTYHSWFSKLYWKNYRSKVPHIAKNTYDYDWQDVLGRMAGKPPEGLNEYVIVDEGQDLPQMLYLLTRSFLTENLTIFADENQRITKDRCMLDDIIGAAQIPREHQFVLQRNYRNTREIYDLAGWFHRGSPTGLALPPERHGNTPLMLAFHSFEEQLESIRNYERLYSSRSIGVLVPKVQDLLRLRRALETAGTVNPVHSYFSGEEIPQFDVSGITILCYQSAKGLEFDAVFLPSLEHMNESDVEQPDTMMNMYVMVTRAREELFLMHEGDDCALRRVLPDHLIRKVDLHD